LGVNCSRANANKSSTVEADVVVVWGNSEELFQAAVAKPVGEVSFLLEGKDR
jgi:hypothetical protein